MTSPPETPVRLEHAVLSGWREARLDLLLAEELAVNHAFAEHLARPGLIEAGRIAPPEAPANVEVAFNVWHEVDDGNAGENDLDVLLTWANGEKRRLLVEDKVWAPLQPRQAERYRGRAESCGGAAVLVAPSGWVKGHADAVSRFHGHATLEHLARWLREHASTENRRRMEWRAGLLDALATRPRPGTALDHAPTIAFRDYCVKRLADAGSAADAQLSSLHTENQGWLWFSHPKDLGFKATSGNIDLYVAVNGFAGAAKELEVRLAAGPLPAEFFVATDTAQNVVIRRRCPRFDTAGGVPHDIATLNEALDACARITLWYDSGGAALLAQTPPDG